MEHTEHIVALTLGVAAAGGVALQLAAHAMRLPAIALLLVGGVILGPEVLNIVRPAALGGGLSLVVSLSVAVILFEGGLTLDIGGFRKARGTILMLLSMGVLITWLGIALAVYILFDAGFRLALVAGSLLVVTGPTVISPLLRRIGVRERIHHVLYWEGVFIDAVGVFLAILAFEWLAAAGTANFFGLMGDFGLRVLLGATAGLGAGLLMGAALHRRWVPASHSNIFALAVALLAFVTCNAILSESGILASIVSGLVLGLLRTPEVQEIKRFKLELTELGIAVLFVLLSAQLELRAFADAGWPLVALIGIVMFVIRPINIWVATAGQGFSIREKTFLSWMAPRGIVAAAMASLFTIRLRSLGEPGADLLEMVTFAIIGTTVIVQGLTAPWVAKVLRLEKPERNTWLLVGHARVVAALDRALTAAGVGAVAVVEDPDEARALRDDDVVVYQGSPVQRETLEDMELAEIGAVLCTYHDPHRDAAVCREWSPLLGEENCYRWVYPENEPSGAGVSLAGKPVWDGLRSPLEVMKGLDAGNWSIDVVDVGSGLAARRFDADFLPLFWVHNGSATLVPLPRQAEPAHEGQAVVLRRRIPNLLGLVQAALIVRDPAPSFGMTVRNLLEAAATGNPALKVEELLRSILERERLMPTAVGTGIAMPHTYSQAVDRTVCYLASVPEGLEGVTPDDEPVRLVFLLISPPGAPQQHVRALAAIAELSTNRTFAELLVQQDSPHAMLELVAERA